MPENREKCVTLDCLFQKQMNSSGIFFQSCTDPTFFMPFPLSWGVPD